MEFENENEQEIFEGFDAFIDYLKELRQDQVALLNIPRVQEMKSAYGTLRGALHDSGCKASIKCGQIDVAPDMGEISIEGVEVEFQGSDAFIKAAKLASNVEAYPLEGNKIRISFGFDHLTNRM